MKTYLDCYSCFIRQTLEAMRIARQNEAAQKMALIEVMEHLKGMDLTASPPMQAQVIHGRIRELTGLKDPYADIKLEHNTELLRLEPTLMKHVMDSPDPLEEALKLAGACNAIDMGPDRSWERAEELFDQLINPLLGRFDLDHFKERLSGAKTMLYLGDNAGEIVGDKILLSVLKKRTDLDITFVVRGAPILNDATLEDAKMVGIDQMAKIITTGSDCPGVILSDCPRELDVAFDQADLILSKGQGNYETLNQEKKDIFFLLQVKCSLVARDLESEVRKIILQWKSDHTH